MTVQTFILLNNGNIDLSVSGIEFNTPTGVIHSANLINFSDGIESYGSSSFVTSTPISSGTYKVFTLDYGYDSAPSNIYVRNVEFSSDLAPITTLTSIIVVGKGSLNTPATLLNSGSTFSDYQENPINGFSFITASFKSNGVFDISNSSQGNVLSGSWVDPYPFSGIGNNFYIKFTRSSFTGSGIYNSSNTTNWLSLAVNREFTVNATGLSNGTPSSASSIFTVEISDDPSGVPLLSSGTYTFNSTGKLAGLINNISNIIISDYGSPDSSAYIEINSNGDIQVYKKSLNRKEVVSIWYLNGGSNIGNDYYVKVTKISGNDFDNEISNDVENFINISNNPKWGLKTLDFGGLKNINLKFEISKNTEYVLSTFSVNIKVDTPAAPVFYGVTATKSNIIEGEYVDFQIKTTYVPTGSTIYWKIIDKLGNLKKEDFQNYTLFNPLFGSFVTTEQGNNQTPVLNRIIRLTTVSSTQAGNNRSFSMIISDLPFLNDGVSAEVFRAESQVVNVGDREPSYLITTDRSSINEGENLTFKVFTSDVDNGTKLKWSISSNQTDSSDFNNQITDEFNIYNNFYEYTLEINNDFSINEGEEKFTIKLYKLDSSGSSNWVLVSQTNEVTINDTSFIIPPTYSITTDGITKVDEGNKITFHVRTTNVSNGDNLWYKLVPVTGNLNSDDFSSRPSTPFSIYGNYHKLEFTINPDQLTDPNESFKILLYNREPKIGLTASILSVGLVATSEIVEINDTSRTPEPIYAGDGDGGGGGGGGGDGGGDGYLPISTKGNTVTGSQTVTDSTTVNPGSSFGVVGYGGLGDISINVGAQTSAVTSTPEATFSDLGSPSPGVVSIGAISIAVPSTPEATFSDLGSPAAPGSSPGDPGAMSVSDANAGLNAAEASATGAECFSPETMITMADGSQKKIIDVKEGDLVRGLTGINKVLKLFTYTIGTNKLHGFNGKQPFVTSCHPIKTLTGWGAFDPEYLKNNWPEDWKNLCKENNGPVVIINEATMLAFWRNDSVSYENMCDHIFIEVPKTYKVYNLAVTNDHTFIAENTVVHNKGECFSPETMITMSDHTLKNITQIQIGDRVLSADGKSINTVKYIEHSTIHGTGYKTYYAPVGYKPFATINHPIYIQGKWYSANKKLSDKLYPWIKTEELEKFDTALTNGELVWNLWVDGDHTYQVNGFGTNSLVDDGGWLRISVEQGYMTKDQITEITHRVSQSSSAVAYGSLIWSNLIGYLNWNWLTKYVADMMLGKRSSIPMNIAILIVGKLALIIKKIK